MIRQKLINKKRRINLWLAVAAARRKNRARRKIKRNNSRLICSALSQSHPKGILVVEG
jgi:hypothetical protein